MSKLDAFMMKGLEDFQYFWESQKWHPKATEMKLLPKWNFQILNLLFRRWGYCRWEVPRLGGQEG